MISKFCVRSRVSGTGMQHLTKFYKKFSEFIAFYGSMPSFARISLVLQNFVIFSKSSSEITKMSFFLKVLYIIQNLSLKAAQIFFIVNFMTTLRQGRMSAASLHHCSRGGHRRVRMRPGHPLHRRQLAHPVYPESRAGPSGRKPLPYSGNAR